MKRNANKLKYNKWMKKNNGENKKPGLDAPRSPSSLTCTSDVPKSIWLWLCRSLCDFQIPKESCNFSRLYFCDFVCCMHNVRLSNLDMWQCQVSMSHVWHWTWTQQLLNLERPWPSQHFGIHKLTRLGFLRVWQCMKKALRWCGFFFAWFSAQLVLFALLSSSLFV